MDCPTHFGPKYMTFLKRHIPFVRKCVGWPVFLLIIDKTNAPHDTRFVLEKVANTLEAASVSCPAARTRHTLGKVFRTVAVGHAACIL
jgi:hypothetical protein